MTKILIDRAVVEQALEALEAMEKPTPTLAETMKLQSKTAKKLRTSLAEQPAEQEPLTDAEKWRMYEAGHDMPSTMASIYMRGVSDAEAAHGITKE